MTQKGMWGSPATVNPVANVANSYRFKQIDTGEILLAAFMERRPLRPHKHDRGKEDSQGKNERKASHPGRPENQGVIESGSALWGELHDPPDTRPEDKIVGQGQEKKDCHEPQLGRQHHRPSRWVRDRNSPLMQQQGARQQEDSDRAPDHRPEPPGDGPKEQRLL